MSADDDHERRLAQSRLVGERLHEQGVRVIQMEMPDINGTVRGKIAGLQKGLDRVPELRAEFWQNAKVTGEGGQLNQDLEQAGRVADFMELAELMCIDALHRTESCGGHFRVESQTPDGEALRDDENFSYVAAWEFNPSSDKPILNREPLTFEHVHPSQRSYK